MVTDSAFSHKIDYVTIFQDILYLEGHPNRITSSKVTAILLNGWILPIGGASSGRVCDSAPTAFAVGLFLVIHFGTSHTFVPYTAVGMCD